MGLIIGIIKKLILLTIYFVVFAAIIVLIPNLPPYTKFTSIKLEPTLSKVGVLAPNTALNNAEKLYNDKLLGPEAYQVYNGEVYTSLANGDIVKLSPGGHVTFVTKIGQPCAYLQDHICGRPLGLDIDEKKGILYVADAYLGIWSVDLKTDKKKLLVSPRVAIGGRQPKTFNSIALDKSGDLYWTDSSSDFVLSNGVYAMITDPSGRLFHYNAAKNESKVLLDNLWFANGVAISSDNQFVVVSETASYRLIKYYINGPKKGSSEIFLAGIPGTPDNLRALPDGSGVLVSLYTVFDEDHPMILKSLSETPLIRKFVARLVRMIEISFEYINNLYPHVFLEEIIYNIGHFKTTESIQSGIAGFLQVDWNGNIVAAYYNTDGTFSSVSDVIVFNDKLYLGAPHSTYVGVVTAPQALKKAFASKPSIKESTKPTAEQAKPLKQAEQKVPEKPKAEAKTPPKVEKPVQQAPKTTPPPKTTEPPKTTTTKPVEKKPVEKEAAKPTPPSTPKSTPPVTPKPPTAAPPKPKETQQSPKAASQKPVDSKPSESAKIKNTEPQKPVKENVPKPSVNKPVPEQIPIKEEIPSDTRKPNKETLKVIKKDGPTEIPNPSV